MLLDKPGVEYQKLTMEKYSTEDRGRLKGQKEHICGLSLEGLISDFSC